MRLMNFIMSEKDLINNQTKICVIWNYIFWFGGLVCMILVAYCIATMLIVFFLRPPPSTIEGCFKMLNENRIIGLLRLDILTVFILPLYYLLFFSIYQAIKRENRELNLFSLILVYAGLTLFLSASSVFSYLILSDRYAIATTEIERNQLVAAGEAILSNDMWHGTSAIIGGIMMQTGGMLFSISMARGNVFNKITGYTGVFIFGLDLIHILIGFAFPKISNIIMIIAGTFYLLWFPLVGFRLFKLSKIKS